MSAAESESDAKLVELRSIDRIAEQMNQVKARADLAASIQRIALLDDLAAGKLADEIVSKCNKIRDLGGFGVEFDPADFGVDAENCDFVEANFVRGVQKVGREYVDRMEQAAFAAYGWIEWAFWTGLRVGGEAQREFERRQI